MGDIETSNLNSSAQITNFSADSETIGNINLTVQGGNSTLDAGGNLDTSNLNSSAQALDFSAQAFDSIDFSDPTFSSSIDPGIIGNINLIVKGGNSTLDAGGNLVTGNLNSSGTIGDINLTVQGGEITITSQNTISSSALDTFTNVNNVNFSGSTFAVSGNGGTIGNLETTEGLSVTSQGGKITLDAVGDIETSNLNSSAQITDLSAQAFDASTNSGTIENLDVTAQGGEVNLTSQNALRTTDINTFANASSIVTSANVEALFNPLSGQIIGNVNAVGGGAIGNIDVEVQGGGINFSSPNTISSSNLNTSADVSDVFASANYDTVLDFSLVIDGSVNTGSGGTIGDLNVQAKGGNISLSPSNTISSETINTSANAENINASANANTNVNTAVSQIERNIDETEGLTLGSGGTIGNISVVADGGEINPLSEETNSNLTSSNTTFSGDINTSANTSNVNASASTSANSSVDTSTSFEIEEIFGNVTEGNGGTIGNLSIVANGGNINSLSEETNSNLTSSNTINTSANTSNVNAFASTAANSSVGTSTNIEIQNVEGNVTEGSGGAIGNLTVEAQGGNINSTSPSTTFSGDIDTSADISNLNASADISDTELVIGTVSGNVIAVLKQKSCPNKP